MKKTAFMWVMLLALFTLAGQVHAQAGPDNDAVVEDREFPEFEKARELYNGGRYDEAVKMLKKYVEKRPVPEAYYMIAYSLYKLGRHDEANKYFKQAFLLEPTYSPTPELEKKLNRSLEVARPGALAPERPMVIPKLLEKRPPVLAEPEEGPSGAAREEPAPAPAEAPALAKPVPAPPEIPKTPTKAPEVAKATPAPPEAAPPPPETAKAPATLEAVPPPPGVSQSTAAPAPPEPPRETLAEKQLISKAAEQISKAADELMGEGEKLSKEAQRLRERPEVAKLRAQLRTQFEQTDPQVLLMGLGILMLSYLFFSYCLFRIAKKLRVSKPWLAWFPVLQVWAFIRAADKSLLLSLLLFVIMFVPFLNLIAAVYVWMGITYNTGRNKWLALLILTPVNILFVVYLAFAKILRRAHAEKDMLGVSDLTAEPSLPDLDFDLEEGKGPDDSWPDEPLG